MPSSQAHVSTASASRYLQQVCKHWSHKFAVEFTPEKAHIPFRGGRICNLEATPDVLTLRAEAPDVEALERLQRVVVEHIKRFAFRIANRATSPRPGLRRHGGGVRAHQFVDRWLIFATQRVRQFGLDRRDNPQPVEYERAVELDQARARSDLLNGGFA